MNQFSFLTNRPDESKAHHQGHVAIHFYSEDAPVVFVKIDGKLVDFPESVDQDKKIYILHIPNSVYKGSGRVWVEINGYSKAINVVNRACKSYTIAWLNPLGGIDHYTFYSNISEKKEVEKEKILTNSGYKVISSYYDRVINCFSDLERCAMKEWISEIFSSPKTWLIENGDIIPIDIVSDEVMTRTDGLSQIEIEFRINQPVILQQS